MFILLAVGILLLVHNAQSAMTARASVHLDSSPFPIGDVTFMQNDASSPVVVSGRLLSLKPDTVHGFHVHRDPLSPGQLNCTAAGPHFNPYNTPHGSITADINNRHVGDLGNVTSDSNGVVTINIRDSIIQLFNATQSIANRAIVLHAMRDDGGQGGFPDSNSTGNAGARIACGNINLSTNLPTIKSRVFPAVGAAIKRRFH